MEAEHITALVETGDGEEPSRGAYKPITGHGHAEHPHDWSTYKFCQHISWEVICHGGIYTA